MNPNKQQRRNLYFFFVFVFYVFILCARFQTSEATKDSSAQVKLQNRRLSSTVVFPVSGNVYPLG